MKITFIIPCYNAAEIIVKNNRKLHKFIKKKKIKEKIIYINDGSRDSTLQELKKIESKSVRILNNKVNLGKSRSIIKALKKARTKNIVLIDCDLPYFNYLNTTIKNLNQYDLVAINRKIKGSVNLDEKKKFIQNYKKLNKQLSWNSC